MLVYGYNSCSNEFSMISQGWLRFMHMKTSLNGKDDDWSMSGEPNEMWDGVTAAPFCSWQRFDLHFACYAFAMMSDVTPAWVRGRKVVTKAGLVFCLCPFCICFVFV